MPTVDIARADLLSALEPVSRVASARTATPILKCARLVAEDGELTVTAGDGEAWAGRSRACFVEEPSSACPDARQIVDTLKAMAGDDVSLTLTPDRVRLVCGKAVAEIPSLDPVDYPEIAKRIDFTPITLSFADFKRLAVPRKSVNPQDQTLKRGVWVEGRKGSLQSIATDGYTLMRSFVKYEGPDCGVLLPPSAFEGVLSLGFTDAEEVTFEVSPFGYRCQRHGAWVTGASFGDKYVQADRAIPDTHTRRWTLLVSELTRALRLALISGGDYKAIVLEGAGNFVRVKSRDVMKGSAVTEVPSSISENTEGFQVALSGSAMLEILSVWPGDLIEFQMTEHTRGVKMVAPDDEGWLAVRMPMDLKKVSA
jgi:DNA polymerase III sliding clamp (beta) subunit (PCNA family)